MEGAIYFEMVVLYRNTTRCHNRENLDLDLVFVLIEQQQLRLHSRGTVPNPSYPV
jgi:hypothetical protein